jgi:hypothetical protein
MDGKKKSRDLQKSEERGLKRKMNGSQIFFGGPEDENRIQTPVAREFNFWRIFVSGGRFSFSFFSSSTFF